ncbi:hypothetical protein M9H77_21282 [Catharanthus roseus]|uniref:Uncharacterized protein n=1 Tax=Catharanthus roseus TaxID=4058 RepID=A0ACC0AMA0_CATRO|nr:hypothetical protein M9H77_21282 [Catharanthus roseus]
MCKVRYHGIEEATWETKEFLRRKYPEILGPLSNDVLSRCTLDMYPVDRGHSIVEGLGPRQVVQGSLVGTLGLVTCFMYKWCVQWFVKMERSYGVLWVPASINYEMPELVSNDPV